jgi:uncharacterized protein
MEAVQRLLADCEWHEMEGMPYGGVFTGTEAIFGNVFGPITQDVEGFTVAPDELLDAGDRVTKFVQYADTRRFGDAVGR